MGKKKKGRSSSGAEKSRKNRFPFLIGFLTVIAVAGLTWFGIQSYRDEDDVLRVKRVLNRLYEEEAKGFSQKNRYSLDIETLWKQAGVEPLALSKYAFGFQRVCVDQFGQSSRISSTLDESHLFVSFSYHDDFYRIQESAQAFFDLNEDTIECIDPKEGFILYAVGNRGDDILDIWMINHEKTVGNIRPSL